MTTPSTPAGWYQDPDGSGGQRYWDGFAWTEHRSPAVAAPTATEDPADEFAASDQATSVVSLPDQPTAVTPTQSAPPSPLETEESRSAGAHRAPDPEPTPPVVPSFEQPSTPSWEVPPTPSWEVPPTPSWDVPSFEALSTPSDDAPSDDAPSTPTYGTPSYEAPSTPSDDAPSTPSYGTPSYEAPSYESPSYDAPPAVAPAAFAGLSGPPAGPGGPGGGPDNRKLIIGFLSAVGGLLLVLILLLVYAFVIRDDHKSEISVGTSTSTTTTTSTETSETATESETPTDSPAPPAGAGATEGDYTFAIARTDSGDTVTSPINEYIEKTASGEFFVVYLNVGNTGAGPLTFLSTLQQLTDGTTTFAPDDEASFYLGGGVVTVNPGEQVETAVVFDVPVGTVPTGIQIHGEPGGAGVEMPLS
jgi:hypothetical protein